MSFEERFWFQVQKSEDGCWIWTGRRSRAGYGVMHRGGGGHSTWRPEAAYRISWELAYGPIPDGLLVRHFVCSNPPCVRPDHLRLGDHRDNAEDSRRDGTMSLGSRHPNAKLTESDVVEIRRLLSLGVTHQKIAEQFGVTSGPIRNIALGKKWRHVS